MITDLLALFLASLVLVFVVGKFLGYKQGRDEAMEIVNDLIASYEDDRRVQDIIDETDRLLAESRALRERRNEDAGADSSKGR